MNVNKWLKRLNDDRLFFIATPAFVWLGLFLVLPLVFILWQGFVGSEGFTLRFFIDLFDRAHVRILVRSVLMAFANAFFCACIAYPVAYWLAFRVNRFRQVWLFLVSLPFWVNFLLHVYSWFFVLERNGVFNSVLLYCGLINEPLHCMNTQGAVLLVMVHAYLPFMIMPIYTILEKCDSRLIEASLDLGARPCRTFFNITLPLSFAGLKVGFFLVFVLSFGEFVIPTLIGGNKSFYVGTLIMQYFLIGHDAHHGAAFTLLSGVVLVCFLSVWYGLIALLFARKRSS
jgi:spermidine/putrescine transport system permease protein